MHKNDNGKYELSMKSIVAFVSLVLLVAGIGGAWGGQRIAVGVLQDMVRDNKSQIGIIQAEQVVLKVELMRLSTNIDNLNRILVRIESRLDATAIP